MLTRLIVVIISQFIQIFNHYVVHLKTNIILYVSYISIFLKKGNPAICDYTDKNGECYANQNKPGKERQMIHDLTYL